MKQFAVYFVFVICLFLLPVAWKSDWVQERYYPEKHWKKKTDHLDALVKFNENELISCHLELKKQQATRIILIRQSILSGRTAAEAAEEFITLFSATLDICNMFSDALQEASDDLELAKSKLADVTP
jgi:hypothetical protein